MVRQKRSTKTLSRHAPLPSMLIEMALLISSWAEALRAAGVEVRIVDPKRVRHFAKAAGRLAKNDPIDAETIAWFAEAFPDADPQPHDAAREELDRLVQARTALKELEGRIAQQGEHGPPPIVAQALAAV